MADTWLATIKDWATGATLSESSLDEEIRDRMQVLSLAVDGDGSASTIKHRHLTGTFAARPAAGEAGRFYYATDLGALFLDDGTLWEYVSHNARLADYDFNDFHEPGSADLTANGYIFGWTFGVGVGAASLTVFATDGQSVARLNALTTSGNVGHLVSYGNNAYITPVSNRNYPLIWETSVILFNNTLVTYHFGLVSALVTTQAAQPTSSAMFAYGRSGDSPLTTLFAVTRDNSGAETKTDTGVTPSATLPTHCRIEIDSSSTARFYVNGVLKATHSAGIPTTELLKVAYTCRTNTAANRTLGIDMVRSLYKRYI